MTEWKHDEPPSFRPSHLHKMQGLVLTRAKSLGEFENITREPFSKGAYLATHRVLEAR